MKLKIVEIPDFIENADNLYRTKHYIIKQVLTLDNESLEGTHIISADTFYKRTKKRDKQFDVLFSDTNHKNGKRLHCTMCSRKYVD